MHLFGGKGYFYSKLRSIKNILPSRVEIEKRQGGVKIGKLFNHES
jgi:hypothetical protein